MDFAYVPDHILLDVLRQLPLHDQVKVGRLSKRLHLLSTLAICKTKRIDLLPNDLRRMTSRDFKKLLRSCSKCLQSASIERSNNIRESYLGVPIRERTFPVVFSRFTYPLLTELNLGFASISNDRFAKIIRKCPKLRSLTWLGRYASKVPTLYPDVVSENMRSVKFDECDYSLVRSLVSKCPNLTQLEFGLRGFVSYSAIDEIFAHCGKVEELSMNLMAQTIPIGPFVQLINGSEFKNFWAMPSLRSFEVWADVKDSFVEKISKCFVQLRSLCLRSVHDLTSNSYASLAALQELRRLITDNFGSDPFADTQKGICQLAKRGILEEAEFACHPRLYPGTLTCLLRYCPNLRRLRIRAPEGIRRPYLAVTKIRSLVGRKQDLEIDFGSTRMHKVWNSDKVKTALEEVNRINGCTIRIISEGYE